jgi:pyruvate dehydrogenase E2 component (dihydrolipoamide acetyltransferase)
MAKSVIMPALGMAQESGVLISWLKYEGQAVVKGEPLMEVETDKATVEIEAPDSGVLGGVSAQAGEVIPVGQTIAWILAEGEQLPQSVSPDTQTKSASSVSEIRPAASARNVSVEASPLARKIAEEHGIDLALIQSNGRRLEKADVLAYIDTTRQTNSVSVSVSTGLNTSVLSTVSSPTRLTPASPKARRLATERGINLSLLKGSGPEEAVLAEDVPLAAASAPSTENIETPGTVWRIMAERMTESWTNVPHFYLIREVDAGNLIEWRGRISEAVEKRIGFKPTYTDLLVKLIGFTLREHPRLNGAWANGNIQFNKDINVGIAVAVEEGLIVPVIRSSDSASIGEIASQRRELIERAQNRKIRPADISDGTFTLSNLGMYNVDAFNAIVNPPQAAILAVGRIAERVVPVNGQVVIRPMMVMTLSCDHRLVDGARGAQFLDDLANLIQDPWRLLA